MLLKNASFTAFTISELLMENQETGRSEEVKLPPAEIRLTVGLSPSKKKIASTKVLYK